MGLDNNDSTIRDLKAYLCDFFCQKIKELSEIDDAEKKDDYIACLIKVAENADNLSSSFEQFEMLGLPIKRVESSDKNSKVVKEVGQILTDNKAVTSDLEKSEESGENSEVKVDDNASTITPAANNSINMILPDKKPIITPPSIGETGEKKKEIKSILAPSIKIEAPALSNMPNIFEGIFNNKVSSQPEDSENVESGEEKEESEIASVSENESEISNDLEVAVEPSNNQENDVVNNNEVIAIPKADDNIINNNNNNNSSVSPLVAAYTNDFVQSNSSDVSNQSVQDNSLNVNNGMKTKVFKLSSDKVKAILVNKGQIEKLSKSLERQKQLLDFGQAGIDQYDIEGMMNRAKQLYDEGRQQEAQQLYNQISQLNKANVLVKKTA